MNYQRLVEISEKLHLLADKHQDLFYQEIKQFKRINSVDDPQQLAQACKALEDQNRLINIGIVGRVKAGKSSLLNALVFDGEPILPKAATPMTAALTTIRWGEAFKAEVEFFSEEDIAAIRIKAGQYDSRLRQKQKEEYDRLVQRETRRVGDSLLDTQKLKEAANKRALVELQREEGLSAAHDQYQRMQASNVNLVTLHHQENIKAHSPQELAECLHDFVGAKGAYMPFTKAVHISMPLEALRDIRIIDTPGMNDPVQSREERTVDLLKTCDVVFIVSPAGQFLNEQDLDMMGRITQKEGIQELVLVASQVDMQLYGSEKRARLDDALESIRMQLSSQAVNVLNGLKKNNPEVGSVFDELINSVSKNLLHTSGLCYSLKRRFDTPEHWDSNEQKTWENLTSEYADYFSRDHQELALNSLDRLANIGALKEVLSKVSEKKAEITSEKLAQLIGAKRKNIEDFRDYILVLAKKQREQVEGANIKDLERQLVLLESKREVLSLSLDKELGYIIRDYNKSLRKKMLKISEGMIGQSKDAVENSASSITDKVVAQKGGVTNWLADKLWDGGKEDMSDVVTKIITSPVISAINKFIDNIERELKEEVQISYKELDINLSQAITRKARETLEEDTNTQMIMQAILSVIQSIPEPRFELDLAIPNELRMRGTLKGTEADNFKGAADEFVNSLDSKASKKINDFIKEVEESLPVTISDFFVTELQRKINILKEQVNNTELTLDRLERLLHQAEEVRL